MKEVERPDTLASEKQARIDWFDSNGAEPVLETVSSVAVVIFSSYWVGGIVMSPMIFASHEFGQRWADILFVAVLFSYPAAMFGGLYLLEFNFFGSDPLAWARSVLVIAAIMTAIALVATRR